MTEQTTAAATTATPAPATQAPAAAPAAPAAEAAKAAAPAATTTQNAAAPADAQKADAGKEAPKAETQTAEVAPEKYEFKAPEGTQLDAAVMTPYSEVAKELGLPQEKAQKVIDKMAPAIAAHQQAQLTAVQSMWKTEAQNDPEIGGAKLAEHSALAQKAYNMFGTPQMVQILEKTGLGSNIEFIRMFSRVGKAISEDNRFVRGGNQGPTSEATTESKLYPNQQQRK